MRFIIDLWLDGYETEEELESACREFINEQLDFTASSVKIIKRLPDDDDEEMEGNE